MSIGTTRGTYEQLSAPRRLLARGTLDRLLAKAMVARMVVAPVLGSISLTFAFFEPTLWRKCLLVTAIGLLGGLTVTEFVRYRRFGSSVVQIPLNVLVTVLAQLILISASGGLFSPALPAVVMMTLATGLLSDRRTLHALLGMCIPTFWVLALVHSRGLIVASLIPKVFGDAHALEHGPAPWLAASLFTLMLAIAARVGSALQGLFDDLFEEALAERDRSLALHAEQTRTLSLLSSEIAHELKNPLASLKGLAALVAKDVDGKTADRMRVLRGEIDRMQNTLEEFLTFSRPLVPLSVAPSDLAELLRDVARLCEVSASERGVVLDVETVEDAVLQCDARKVRQVLINLLQNALEASPPGATVKLRVAHLGQAVSATISDEGDGLSEQIRERVFEPFVTSKEHGSGIGLVVARALARQHGGEVSLTARVERTGLIAELRLPCEPTGAQP